MVTAAQRRRAVEHLKSRRISERRACRLVGFGRSAAWYRLQGREDSALRNRLKALAERYPRYGYPTLHDLLKTEGLVTNPKRTYRIYREEGLQVRTKRRRKLHRPRVPLSVPTAINERWTVDFVSDQLANGRRFRVFNVVDDFSRERVLQVVDFSISGERLTHELDRLAKSRPLAKKLVLDNGPELTSKAMFFWAKRRGVRPHFIQPGKPTQNAFAESFNARFREYCLNLNWFASLQDARSTIESWRAHYNHVRPHRSLGRKPPAVLPERLPDMLNFPHQAMLGFRGTVKRSCPAIKSHAPLYKARDCNRSCQRPFPWSITRTPRPIICRSSQSKPIDERFMY